MLFIEADLSTIITKISKKKIKKQFIEVEILSSSTSVMISNIIETKKMKTFLHCTSLIPSTLEWVGMMTWKYWMMVE